MLVRETTVTVVRGLGRAFLCLSVCLSVCLQCLSVVIGRQTKHVLAILWSGSQHPVVNGNGMQLAHHGDHADAPASHPNVLGLLPREPKQEPAAEESEAEDAEDFGNESFRSNATSNCSAADDMGSMEVTEYLREQDRFMPIAIIAKIMARELAHLGYAKISHDAKSLMQEAATEFICFLMSEANDQALQAKRKSVTGQDFINACDKLGACRLASLAANEQT